MLREIKNKKDTTISSPFLYNNTNSVEIVNYIIKYGIDEGASDIHIRQVYDKLSLEYRIDGKLIEKDIEIKMGVSELIARIKIMSKLNVAEKRMPQDGAMSFKYDEEDYDIRVASLPTIAGESLVLRLLKTTLSDISLSNLGYSPDKEKIIRKLCKKTNGLILITGPTGSGKSTTLLSLIDIINDGEKKIITIEDPVENKIENIVQIQVKEDIGLTFEKILRTCLRSDPDVIIISEIRDEITAEIAVRAALTGHLVLATLHTNDSISTFSRLIDMKIPKYLILDSLLCILSQRLVRLDDYDVNLSRKRVCINELLEMNDINRDIFNNNIEKSTIEKLLKARGFKTLEDELKICLKRECNGKISSI